MGNRVPSDVETFGQFSLGEFEPLTNPADFIGANHVGAHALDSTQIETKRKPDRLSYGTARAARPLRVPPTDQAHECPGGDLNPHALAGIGSSSRNVCQFRHRDRVGPQARGQEAHARHAVLLRRESAEPCERSRQDDKKRRKPARAGWGEAG
jgi:hypothetical protein